MTWLHSKYTCQNKDSCCMCCSYILLPGIYLLSTIRNRIKSPTDSGSYLLQVLLRSLLNTIQTCQEPQVTSNSIYQTQIQDVVLQIPKQVAKPST